MPHQDTRKVMQLLCASWMMAVGKTSDEAMRVNSVTMFDQFMGMLEDNNRERAQLIGYLRDVQDGKIDPADLQVSADGVTYVPPDPEDEPETVTTTLPLSVERPEGAYISTDGNGTGEVVAEVRVEAETAG